MISPNKKIDCPIAAFFVRLAIALAFAGTNVANAIDLNRELPISIESDRAEIDDSAGISTYRGNVVISQGTTTLTADNIAVIASERTIAKIVANGQPAKFRQTELNTQYETAGQAEQITYIANDSILVFEGNAVLNQQTNSFSGDRIEYDIMRKAIRAKGDQNSGTRVKIQYFPSQSNLKSDDQGQQAAAESERAQ